MRVVWNLSFSFKAGVAIKNTIFKQLLQCLSAYPLSGIMLSVNRNTGMYKSEEEKVNIVIGEAVLSLIDKDIDISAETLSEHLRQMHALETDGARRGVINDAIQLTSQTFLH